MSRYVIDSANETTMIQEIGVTEDGKTYVNCHYVTELDELTPDYIRKHFGQMLADAYQRGLIAGKDYPANPCTLCAYGGENNIRGGCGYKPYCKHNYPDKFVPAQDNEIKVGDVVRSKLDPDMEIWVTEVDRKEGCISGYALGDSGNCEIGDKYDGVKASYYEKMNRHFSLLNILDGMHSRHQEAENDERTKGD